MQKYLDLGFRDSNGKPWSINLDSPKEGLVAADFDDLIAKLDTPIMTNNGSPIVKLERAQIVEVRKTKVL